MQLSLHTIGFALADDFCIDVPLGTLAHACIVAVISAALRYCLRLQQDDLALIYGEAAAAREAA